METPPVLFIEIALLRLGRRMLDGLDPESPYTRAQQIITHWHRIEEISDEVRHRLLKCWQEFFIDIRTRDRELSIRRSEGRSDIEDVHKETQLSYIEFCGCVGDCLDPLYAA